MIARAGVLVISHGSRDPQWVMQIDETINQVRLSTDVPIYSSFLELVENRLIQQGIDALEAQGVTDLLVIPLFISSGSTHVTEIRTALGLPTTMQFESDLQAFTLKARVHMAEPIDDHPLIAELIYEQIRNVSRNPAQEIVLVVGHGSVQKGFHLRWRRGLEQLAERVKRRGGFAECDYAMLKPDQIEWKMKRWQSHRPDCTVVVAPFFLSEGYFTKKVIPARLQPYPHLYHGRTLLPHPYMVSWIEQQIEWLMKRLEP